jgi:hypothetical protein
MPRAHTGEDLARAVFAAATDAGGPVPMEQTSWVAHEIARLVGDNEIVAVSAVAVGGASGYVFAIFGEASYLLRWKENDLEISFLAQRRGLKYRELSRGLGDMQGFEGEPWLRVEFEHELLPATVSLEAREWQVGEIRELRETLRSWTETP